MKVLFITLFLAAGLVLSGCASSNVATDIATAESDDVRQELLQTVFDDLTEAKRSADFHDDILASACYERLLDLVGTVQEEGYFTEVVAGFSAYQKARNIRRKISSGFSDETKLACTALKEDSKEAIFGIFGRIGLPIPII